MLKKSKRIILVGVVGIGVGILSSHVIPEHKIVKLKNIEVDGLPRKSMISDLVVLRSLVDRKSKPIKAIRKRPNILKTFNPKYIDLPPIGWFEPGHL